MFELPQRPLAFRETVSLLSTCRLIWLANSVNDDAALRFAHAHALEQVQASGRTPDSTDVCKMLCQKHLLQHDGRYFMPPGISLFEFNTALAIVSGVALALQLRNELNPAIRDALLAPWRAHFSFDAELSASPLAV